MPSSAYIFRTDGGSADRPDFRLDATLREGSELSIQWSQYPIESNATVSDYGWLQPEKATIEGIVTPLQFAVGATEDFDRLRTVMSKLRALADGRTLVTLVTTFESRDVVIAKVAESRTVQDGRALRVKIDFQAIKRASRRTIQVPPSRLRRPKRGSANAKTQWYFQRVDRKIGLKGWNNMTWGERETYRRSVKGFEDYRNRKLGAGALTEQGGEALP